MRKSHNIFKSFAIVLLAIVLVGAGYTVFAYVTKTWPFGDQGADNGAQTTGANSKSPDSTANPKKDGPEYDFQFDTKLETKKQGDCTLVMKDSSGKTVITDKNSTIGKEGKVGCDTWKLDTSDLPNGDYKIVVDFEAEGESATSETTVTIEH